MDAERVEVLHVADGDTVVVLVAHHLVFDFLPAFQRLFDEHLRGEREGFLGLCQELFLVVAEARAKTSQGVGCTEDDGEAQFMGCTLHLLDGATGLALDGLHANLIEALHKEIAILGIDDGLDGGAQHLDTILLEHTTLIEFHTTVEGCLTTKREQDTIRALFLDDTLHKVGLHRLEIDRISHPLGSLHGGDVGIDEHRVDALFLQGLQGLCTTIVELSCLTYLQGSRAQKQNLFDFFLFHHPNIFTNSSNKNSVSTGPEQASGWN